MKHASIGSRLKFAAMAMLGMQAQGRTETLDLSSQLKGLRVPNRGGGRHYATSPGTRQRKRRKHERQMRDGGK